MKSMKGLFASLISLVLFATPALALADNTIPIGPTPLQLLARVAALDAQISSMQSGQALACAALADQTTVKVNEPFALAWGSVGALDPATASSTQSMWTQNGGTMVSIQTPGPWTYSFTFYSASGGSVTCTVKILVQ